MDGIGNSSGVRRHHALPPSEFSRAADARPADLVTLPDIDTFDRRTAQTGRAGSAAGGTPVATGAEIRSATDSLAEFERILLPPGLQGILSTAETSQRLVAAAGGSRAAQDAVSGALVGLVAESHPQMIGAMAQERGHQFGFKAIWYNVFGGAPDIDMTRVGRIDTATRFANTAKQTPPPPAGSDPKVRAIYAQGKQVIYFQITKLLDNPTDAEVQQILGRKDVTAAEVRQWATMPPGQLPAKALGF